jgi:hypothetical protein
MTLLCSAGDPLQRDNWRDAGCNFLGQYDAVDGGRFGTWGLVSFDDCKIAAPEE